MNSHPGIYATWSCCILCKPKLDTAVSAAAQTSCTGHQPVATIITTEGQSTKEQYGGLLSRLGHSRVVSSRSARKAEQTHCTQNKRQPSTTSSARTFLNQEPCCSRMGIHHSHSSYFTQQLFTTRVCLMVLAQPAVPSMGKLTH